jgi:hypothetical protein
VREFSLDVLQVQIASLAGDAAEESKARKGY